MFIVRPQMTPEEADKVLEEIQNVINAKGEVTSVDRWGKRRFAYEIEHHTEGYYYVVQFNASPDHIAEVDRRLKINDNVLRHIIVRTDED
jgi:small subunit ribosomal protein S6